VGITGIAGPGGGTPEKPVGTFFIAVATDKDVSVKGCLFVNERSFVQRYAVHAAMELVRRVLVGNALGAPFPSEMVK
jgi:nicotinamide-nucleotide amidase